MSAEVRYQAFILRVWRERVGGVRASVTNIDDGRQRAFANLEELCAWLEHLTSDRLRPR